LKWKLLIRFFNVVAKEMGLKVVPGINVSADENFGPLGNQRSIAKMGF
jgi:hypothetical protein